MKFLRISIISFALFLMSMSIHAKENKIEQKIAEFNSQNYILFIYQSYYTIDILQREIYICNCTDSLYNIKVLDALKTSFRIYSTKLSELKKISEGIPKLNKDIIKLLDIAKYLNWDIRLFDIYLEDKKEDNYKEFLEVHTELWEKLEKLNDKK